ncbi:MAG: hypothetical protein QXS02_05840 [Candidatus Thermoplasmatota archaeon]
MIKKRIIDFRNISIFSLLSRLLLLVGVLLTFSFVFLRFVLMCSYESGIVLAFSILFIGVGLLLYFFHIQFRKLSRIAEEVESMNEEMEKL